MLRIFSFALALALSSCTTSGTATLDEVVRSQDRSEQNAARDVYRNPKETLDFFDVQPNMSVVEISPGAGWYTEILGPYLKSGRLYLAIFADDSDKSYALKLNNALKEKIRSYPDHYATVQFTTLDSPKHIGPIAPANSVDRVLTFRNVHNWMKDGTAREVFQEFYRALKPGGVLGVVEHRAKATDQPQDPKAESGYVREDFVIELAESVGFALDGKSEINANPKDTTTHPKGVWTLPPSLRLQEVDKEKYLAIGESDRMTLKFRKPVP